MERFACPRCGATIEMPNPEDMKVHGRLHQMYRVVCYGPPIPVDWRGHPAGGPNPPLAHLKAHTVLFEVGVWQDGPGRRRLAWKDPVCPATPAARVCI